MVKEETLNPVPALIRKLENQYVSGSNTYISKYVDFDLYENNNKIDAYLNSRHISGEEDSLGRPKPFMNVVISARNIWFRATDLDRKNLKIKSKKVKQIIASYLANAKMHDWMNRENFGQFLNDWGLQLASYGSSMTKWVEQDGRLIPRTIPWGQLIIDPIDYEQAPVIEVLEYTESELRQHSGYDKEVVEALCDAKSARETLSKQKKDNRSNYIKVYEIHGKLPLSYLTQNEEDEDTYVQQMHVISFVGKGRGDYDDFTLASGREKKSPYLLTHLIKEENRATGRGAVESLFTTQWMINHSAKQIKDQLDLASKLIFQTSDGNFVGQNALTAIMTGDILVHAPNAPITQVANNSHDITSLMNFSNQWKTLGNEITGISESMLGINPPSGTAWRQTEAILQENHSLFQLMTQNKGLALEQMGRQFIIPYIKTKLNNTDEIVASLSDWGIDKISSKHIKAEAKRLLQQTVIKSLLEGQPAINLPSEAEVQSMVHDKMFEDTSNVYIKPSDLDSVTWAQVFKDFEWDCEFEITGENEDKLAALTTLNTLLQLVIAKQGQPFTPRESLIVNKILSLTGEVSPAEIDQIDSTEKTFSPMVQPQMVQPPQQHQMQIPQGTQ